MNDSPVKISPWHSLKYRIALIVFVLEVLLLTFVLTQTLSFIKSQTLNDTANRHRVQFDLIRDVTRDALFSGEFENLQSFIEKMSLDSAIISITAINDKGTVVAHNLLDQVGTIFDPQREMQSGQWSYEDINGLGKVYVLFSLSSQEERMAAARELGFSIALTGILIIGVIGLLFGYLLTRRLNTLTVAVDTFRGGKHSVKADVAGRDEVAVLAKTFNFMSAKILETMDKLKSEREQLEHRVLQRTRELHDAQQELLRKNQELEILSTIDRLTQIYNRGFLEDTLDKAIARANRTGRTFGIILIDIDDFKRINDSMGHDNGDTVIKTVATTIARAVRDSGVVGRWGGEEFLVICVESEFDAVRELASCIHRLVAEQPIDSVGKITASLGLAMYVLGDSETEILKRADLALYEAKNAGKNCIKSQTALR